MKATEIADAIIANNDERNKLLDMLKTLMGGDGFSYKGWFFCKTESGGVLAYKYPDLSTLDEDKDDGNS